MIEHLLGVDSASLLWVGGLARLVALDADVHDGLAGVRDGVGAELYVLVLYDLIPQQVAKSVIFVQETVGRIVLITLRPLNLNLWIA